MNSQSLGSVTPKRLICEETVRRCREAYESDLLAIVLTGSLARDEHTLTEASGCWHFLSDADVLLIVREEAALPSAQGVDAVRHSVEGALQEQGVSCHVTLSAGHPAYLRGLGPQIYAYELRQCGQVLWGDATALSLIPSYSPAEISREDAWRLLCNRMIEQLELVVEVAGAPAELSPRGLYGLVKLYLDMATSFLVFAGAYEPTYRGRLARLEALVTTSVPGKGPFPLGDFVERVRVSTRVKLAGSDVLDGLNLSTLSNDYWLEAIGYAERLWRWELARLTGLSRTESSHALSEALMRLQPRADRLRGWLFVLRAQGWHRSWRQWAHWVHRAWRASPRYWTYAVASELFFRLPWLLPPGGPDTDPGLDAESLRQFLPVRSSAGSSGRRQGWRGLALDVAWNYRHFLEGTRA